jgi:hypothetical protein
MRLQFLKVGQIRMTKQFTKKHSLLNIDETLIRWPYYFVTVILLCAFNSTNTHTRKF